METTIWMAFVAGILSCLSPCTLPLYPSYLSYITGISVGKLKESPLELRKHILIHTCFFILGFSVVFYSFGYTVSWIGQTFIAYQSAIRMIGAIILFTMGLFLMGLFTPNFLLKEKRLQLPKKRWGYFGTLFIGISFAAGWTPCIGPIFSAILTMAAYQPELAFIQITAYILGFTIPFLILAFFIGRMNWILKYSERVMKIGGALMVLFAFLLYTDKLNSLSIWLTHLFTT